MHNLLEYARVMVCVTVGQDALVNEVRRNSEVGKVLTKRVRKVAYELNGGGSTMTPLWLIQMM